jgi:hypothetical protein
MHNIKKEMGRLSAKVKLRLARLKLWGVAKSFYSTQLELEGDDVEYADFKTAFIQRYKDKPPRWCLYFDVVVGLVWSNDPESYAGGSVATGRITHAGQVEGDDPD